MRQSPALVTLGNCSGQPGGLAVFYPYDRHPSLLLAFLSLAALVILSAAAILAPDSAATHANFANLLAKQPARDEAMAQYSEALRLNPGFVEAHYNIASLLLEEGRTKDAAARCIAALQIKANYVPAMVSLAWIYATDRGNAATQHAAEAVRLAEQAC